MTREELQQFSASRGYRVVGNTVMGIFQGYPFSAVFKEGRTSSLTAQLHVDRAPKNKVLRQLRGQLPQGSSVSRVNSSAVLLVCASKSELAIQFQEAMKQLTDLLREQGTDIPARCPLCRGGDCDSAAYVGGAYVPAHRSCCEARSSSAVADAETNQVRGNYLPGFIGALLGGLVGALPSVLTIWFLETIFAVLYALIPLGAYYGYKLLGGRMNRAAAVAAVLSSVIQLFMVEFIVFYIALHTVFGIWPNPFAAVAFYFENYSMGDMLASLAMPALFTLLGLWIVSRQITRTNASVVTDANALLESLLPLKGGQ